MRKIIIFGITVVAVCSGVMNVARADEKIVSASKDAWIDQEKSDDNHGLTENLAVRTKKDDKNKRVLISFDLLTIPSNSVIESAVLKLYMHDVPAEDRVYGVYRITSEWSELSVNWDSNIQYAASATSTTQIIKKNKDQYFSWEVTDDVFSFVASESQNYGWIVKDEAENSESAREAKFKSREEDDPEKQPLLQINYHIPGSITVTKNTIGGDGTFDFTGNAGNFSIITSGSMGSHTIEGLTSGTYGINEIASPGWHQTSNNCGNVMVTYGSASTCTFTNTKYGRIIVEKIVVNNDSGSKTADDFSFTVNGSGSTAFEADGQNEILVEPGVYTITEISVDEYSASYENCDELNVGAGDETTCTITNNDIPRSSNGGGGGGGGFVPIPTPSPATPTPTPTPSPSPSLSPSPLPSATPAPPGGEVAGTSIIPTPTLTPTSTPIRRASSVGQLIISPSPTPEPAATTTPSPEPSSIPPAEESGAVLGATLSSGFCSQTSSKIFLIAAILPILFSLVIRLWFGRKRWFMILLVIGVTLLGISLFLC